MTTEFTFTKSEIKQRLDGDYEITLVVPKVQKNAVLSFAESMRDNAKAMLAKIAVKRNRRSLDANAYAWVLITELANVLRSGKDETYIRLIKEYGQRQLIKLPTAGLSIILRAVKYYDIKNEIDDCTYIMVYAGSSEYDTREMSIFIDGIVSECRAQGIDTMTPAELERIKGEWNNGKEDKKNC